MSYVHCVFLVLMCFIVCMHVGGWVMLCTCLCVRMYIRMCYDCVCVCMYVIVAVIHKLLVLACWWRKHSCVTQLVIVIPSFSLQMSTFCEWKQGWCSSIAQCLEEPVLVRVRCDTRSLCKGV